MRIDKQLYVAVVMIFCLFLSGSPSSLAQTLNKEQRDKVSLAQDYDTRLRNELNEWALSIAAGKLGDTSSKMAAELSRVLDDGNNLLLLPILTRGPSSNLHALLYLRGIDLAVVNADIMDYYIKQKSIPNIKNRINYITQLFLSELHILARPEVKTLEDLKGKVVNFNTPGTSAAFSGVRIFKRFGIKVTEKFLPNTQAIAKMKQGSEISAVVFMTGKPVPYLQGLTLPSDFHFLPIKYNSKLTDYYLPTSLISEDYPNLIPAGKAIATIAVPTFLATFNWPQKTQRYRKIERFIDYMFRRWEKLLKPPFHKKWKNINLNASIAGWNRFPAMQAYLNKYANTEIVSNPKTKGKVDGLQEAFDRFLKNYAKTNGLSGFSATQKEQLFQQFYRFWKETNTDL